MHDAGDMAMTPYLPILDQPVQLHSSRDPGKCKLTPAQCDFKSSYWVFWYEADLVYSLAVVYFLVAVVAVFAIGRVTSDFAPRSIKLLGTWRRPVSALRLLSYKTWRLGGMYSQPMGAYLLATIGTLYFSALTLGPKPYYWPTDAKYGNSPPIATRTGWMALACLPFIIAFGTKANLVSALTGIPPEKLNVWHKWVSWAMLVLALIHTFPFVVVHDEKGDTAVTFQTGGVWLTGVIALIAQAWLTFMSVSWIRNRWYEFFKATHLFFAAAFVVFFFLHCDFRLSSWDYFIAAGVIYFACFFWALANTCLRHGIKHRAQVCLESPFTLRIAIPTSSNWNPGQHVYVRFLTTDFHVLTSHPLTICSLPSKTKEGNEMILYAHPRGGITRQLAVIAQKQPESRIGVLLEGPYGGMPRRWYEGFDSTLLVAGGSGSAFTLPLIEDWLSRHDKLPRCQLQVLLATRDPTMRNWYIEQLQRMADKLGRAYVTEALVLSIHFHETCDPDTIERQSPHTDRESASLNSEKRQSETVIRSPPHSIISSFGLKFFRGRPDTASALREMAVQQVSGSVGIAVCGPSSMGYDVSREAAAQQQRIIRGHSGASEVWLHKESFSY